MTKVAQAKTPKSKNSLRKTPLYHNAKLEAPDGQQLCVCDDKKAKWYVTHGLGRYIKKKNPIIVRLNFEPA